MPSFGRVSQSHLNTCDPRLIEIFEEVVKHIDCSCLCGRRTEFEQNLLFTKGKTQVKWPDSKHNCPDGGPSKAIDIVPYPIDWNDRERFHHFAGFAQGIAKSMGYTLRWGGDWDCDSDFKDNNFDDLPHFEIVD